jgi:hypothetical protein
MQITEYTTRSGSVYRVDLERKRVQQVGVDTEWRQCVEIVADGRLLFTESVIPEADPPLYHFTRTTRIVGVRYV